MTINLMAIKLMVITKIIKILTKKSIQAVYSDMFK
jgi:hypothetical protein